MEENIYRCCKYCKHGDAPMKHGKAYSNDYAWCEMDKQFHEDHEHCECDETFAGWFEPW